MGPQINVQIVSQSMQVTALFQVRNLRERLEEEHQALLQREQDKVSLEVRIARLTRIILHSTRISRPSQTYGQRYRQLLLSEVDPHLHDFPALTSRS